MYEDETDAAAFCEALNSAPKASYDHLRDHVIWKAARKHTLARVCGALWSQPHVECEVSFAEIAQWLEKVFLDG